MQFTSLERAVLDWIADNAVADVPPLRAMISAARVTGRQNTGVGFYTDISIPTEARQPLTAKQMLDGPIAHMVGLGPGMIMGFMLWIDDGVPNCLEGYQFSDRNFETVDLNSVDLETLTFTRLEPFQPG